MWYFIMRNPLKIIAPLVIATGLPLAAAGVANAADVSITACAVTPVTFSLAPGEAQNVTVSWDDAVNSPGDMADVTYQEMIINGGAPVGQVGPIGIGGGSNPYTIPYPFEALSGVLSGQAGTVTFSFYATDGTTKVGSELCSLTATVAASPVSTTTTTVATTTLATTGSNTGTFLAGGMMILAFGGALYVSGRRRSVK
jgi:LPXTG-motif cell wall-anchored protein